MKFYLVKRNNYDYDEYVSFVVRAKSAKTARKLASGACGYGRGEFLDPAKSTCVVLPAEGPAAVVHDHYRSG